MFLFQGFVFQRARAQDNSDGSISWKSKCVTIGDRLEEYPTEHIPPHQPHTCKDVIIREAIT